MPRKKLADPMDQVLGYFDSVTITEAELLVKIVLRGILARKSLPSTIPVPVAVPQPLKVRKTRGPNKPKVAVAADQPKPRQPRRMKANSQPPTSEATPLVPLQTAVGDGDDSNPVIE